MTVYAFYPRRFRRGPYPMKGVFVNMHEQTLKENKMGAMPVGQLLITMALPMIVSMLVQALYNVGDSIFRCV